MPLVPAQDFQFCGPTYLGASPLLDAQRSINLYPDPGISSSKSRMGLTGRPGLAAPGSTALGAGFGHSLWAGNGRLFVATGSHIYEVNQAGGIITDYGTGLSNFGPTPVPMIANGTQLLACDSAANKIFNVNPSGPSLDFAFNGSALEYLDDFYVAIAAGASLAGVNPNQINVSALADGTSWPALAFAIRTGSSDLTIQLAVLNGLLYIFGQKTIEVWYNAGNAIFPFARVSGGVINLGCLAAGTVVKFSNCVMWLGSDQTGAGQVWMMQGLNPTRVSNPAIEAMIIQASSNLNLAQSTAFGYEEAGHTFWVLNIKGNSLNLKTTQTLVYDLVTGLWHERAYAGAGAALVPCGFAFVGGNFNSALTPQFMIDELSGQIWYESILIPSDGVIGVTAGTAITYTRCAPHVGNENQWFKYPRFDLDLDQGNGNIAPVLDYANGKVINGQLQYLGYNYPMAKAPDQGAAGTAQRFYATQLGRSRDRSFKVTITESVNLVRIANAYLTAEVLK